MFKSKNNNPTCLSYCYYYETKKQNETKQPKPIALYHILRRGLKAFCKAGHYPCSGGNARAVLNSLPKADIIHSPVTCPLSPKHERRESGDNSVHSHVYHAITAYENRSFFAGDRLSALKCSFWIKNSAVIFKI